MIKTKYFFGFLLIASLVLSCKKDASYNVKGSTGVKFFTNNTGSGNAPDNSISYNVVNIPDAASSGLLNLSNNIPVAVKFPVFATKAVSDDVAIEAIVDNSFVSEYNIAHNTNYAALPGGILKTDGLIAHIAKGATISSDSITLVTTLTDVKSLTEKVYMAPVKLTTSSNRAVGIVTDNTSSQVVYIVFNVELRRIKYLATAADALGALVNPRTSWVATFSPAPATAGNIFDASTTTFSRWAASPGLLDVNMQATKNVTGIRLYTSNSATTTPTQIEVYLSNDGINYDLIGSPLRANLTYASSYNYILFYKAIQAKYIRLKLYYSTSTNTQNLRVTEFDVYAN